MTSTTAARHVRFTDDEPEVIGNSRYVDSNESAWIDSDVFQELQNKDVRLIQSGCIMIERRGLETLLDQGFRKRLIAEHIKKIVKKSHSILCTESSLANYLKKSSAKQLTRAQQVAEQDEIEAQRYQKQDRVFPRQQVRDSLGRMQQKQVKRSTTQPQPPRQRISMPTQQHQRTAGLSPVRRTTSAY